jgi:hypothetical protein
MVSLVLPVIPSSKHSIAAAASFLDREVNPSEWRRRSRAGVHTADFWNRPRVRVEAVLCSFYIAAEENDVIDMIVNCFPDCQ